MRGRLFLAWSAVTRLWLNSKEIPQFGAPTFLCRKIASIASLKGSYKYPTELLKDVTEDMLNVQFHDILPGDMIRAGEENGFTYINHGLHILNNIRADAFFALCKGQPVAEENTYPLMVFNPKATAEKQIIECELSIIPTGNYIEKRSYVEVYDDKGNKLKSQTVKEGSNISIDWRKKSYSKPNRTLCRLRVIRQRPSCCP